MGFLDWIPVVGDVVNGVSNVVSTAMTNKSNKQIAREQNQWNLEQWNREADFTREMWNATNEYNDPSQQMKRLTDAGLSPWGAASVLGAGDASGVATPSGSPAAGATMQAPNFDFFGSAAEKVLSTQLKQAEIRKANAEADSAEVKADQDSMYNNLFWRDYTYEGLNSLILGNRKAANDVALGSQALEINSGNFLLDSALKRQQQKMNENSIQFGQIQNYIAKVDQKMKEIGLEAYPAQIRANLALAGAQADAASAAAGASREAAEASRQQALKTAAEAAGVKRSNWIAEQLAPFTISEGMSRAYQAENDRYGKYVGFGRGIGEFIRDSFFPSNSRVLRKKRIKHTVNSDFDRHTIERKLKNDVLGRDDTGYWFDNNFLDH